MSDKEGHLQKAAHNLSYAKTFNLNQTKYLDWAAVAIFYTAMHYVDAFLATEGYREFENHGERNKKVEELLDPISHFYLPLYEAARNARYKPYYKLDSDRLIRFEVTNLAQIEYYILTLLK